MQLEYNRLNKDVLYKILLHVNDLTKLSDEELKQKEDDIFNERLRRGNLRRVKNVKQMLMKIYEIVKPSSIPFEKYKDIVDGISNVSYNCIVFKESPLYFQTFKIECPLECMYPSSIRESDYFYLFLYFLNTSWDSIGYISKFLYNNININNVDKLFSPV